MNTRQNVTITRVPADPMHFTPESVKAAVVLPPVDDDRLLSRVGGAIEWSRSVPARGSRTMNTRPKGTSQVVSDVRLGYRRPSIG